MITAPRLLELLLLLAFNLHVHLIFFHFRISTNGVYGEDVIGVPVRDQPIRFLEHVTATVALNYTGERGLVEINVISPSGLTSPLLTLRRYDFISGGEMSWTFKSVHFWGENPIGSWRLQFRSVQRVAVGKICFTCNNLKLELQW